MTKRILRIRLASPLLVLPALLLVFPPAAAQAGFATDFTHPAPDLVDLLVHDIETSCSAEREAALGSSDAQPVNLPAEAYARCAAPLFVRHLGSANLDYPCPPDFSERGGSSDAAACIRMAATQPGIATRLDALGQACDAMADNVRPVGCSLRDYCEGCPDQPVGVLAEESCGPHSPSCGGAEIGVEYLETRLTAVCAGNLTLLDEVPDRLEWSGGTSGILGVFHWTLVRERNVTETTSFDFRCVGQPAVVGRAWGGFMRQLHVENETSGGPVCKYDGLIDDGCIGAFGAETAIGYSGGVFDVRTGEGTLPPDVMQLSHEAGWFLLNVGQGSTRVYTGADPDPVPVPPKAVNYTVNYTMQDLRGSASRDAPGLVPGIVAPTILALAWLSRGKRVRRAGRTA